ncbi:hypothetical protein F0521_17140 [Ferrimonas sp. YFM]|nr:hypothetical protein F0521_17140 [Ferrimonas sp. YFM]
MMSRCMEVALNKFITLVFILLIQGCVQKSDTELSQLIVGTWSYNYDSGSYGFIEYTDNGDKCEMNFSFGESGNLSINLYWNKWQVEDSIIKSKVHASTVSVMEKGYVIHDKVIEINSNVLTVDMIVPEGNFKTEYHQKSKYSESGKVCSIVKMHLKRALR